METIIEILKSAPCCASAPLRERLEAIQDMSNTYTVNALCDRNHYIIYYGWSIFLCSELTKVSQIGLAHFFTLF